MKMLKRILPIIFLFSLFADGQTMGGYYLTQSLHKNMPVDTVLDKEITMFGMDGDMHTKVFNQQVLGLIFVTEFYERQAVADYFDLIKAAYGDGYSDMGENDNPEEGYIIHYYTMSDTNAYYDVVWIRHKYKNETGLVFTITDRKLEAGRESYYEALSEGISITKEMYRKARIKKRRIK